MDFTVIADNLPLYFNGLWMTLQLVFLSLACGIVMSVPMGLAASSRNSFISFLPKAYIYFFRGTPLLIQMFLIYHGSGQFDKLRESFLWVVFQEAYWCALIAFALNTTGYTAEILRGAIVQTNWGEIEAAKAYGMSKFTRYRRVHFAQRFSSGAACLWQ